MKEAIGESHMTVIVIILIGIVLALGVPIIKNLMETTESKAECEQQGLCYYNGSCGEC